VGLLNLLTQLEATVETAESVSLLNRTLEEIGAEPVRA
jgi:hypothetical protein